jgi:hypothetical protein
MKFFRAGIRTVACLVILITILGSGCDMHLDRNKALVIKRRTEIVVLVSSLDTYNKEHGKLPDDLEALTRWNPQLNTINLSIYEYDPEGIPVADAKSCLILAGHPLESNRVFIGRLPPVVEVIPRKTILSKSPKN